MIAIGFYGSLFMLIHVNCTDYWSSLCNLQMYVCFDQILPPSTLSCPFLTFSLPITGPFTDTGTLVNFHLFSYIFPSSLYQLAYLPPMSFFPMFSVFTVFVSCIICHFWFDKVSLCSLSWQPTLSSPFSAFWLLRLLTPAWLCCGFWLVSPAGLVDANTSSCTVWGPLFLEPRSLCLFLWNCSTGLL